MRTYSTTMKHEDGRKIEVQFSREGEHEEDTNVGPIYAIGKVYDVETGWEIELTDDAREKLENELMATYEEDHQDD